MRQFVNLLFTSFLRLIIRIYQWGISPLLGPSCRYAPSCSAYMETAIGRFGPWAGSWMGFARLCRCHPWADWGCDPVPEHLPDGARWYKPWRYGHWTGKHMHQPDDHHH